MRDIGQAAIRIRITSCVGWTLTSTLFVKTGERTNNNLDGCGGTCSVETSEARANGVTCIEARRSAAVAIPQASEQRYFTLVEAARDPSVRPRGLILPQGEHVMWKQSRLRPGDELRVKIVEAEA